jgi:hypothetical protein
VKFIGKISAVLIFVHLVVCCQLKEQEHIRGKDNHSRSKRKTSGREATFICLPDTLQPAGVMTISLPEAHPTKLAVVTPGNEFVYLHDPPQVVLMSAEEFKKSRKIEIPQNITGLLYKDGRGTKQPVFVAEGNYQLIVADNLETELTNTAYVDCTIFFKTGGRKN